MRSRSARAESSTDGARLCRGKGQRGPHRVAVDSAVGSARADQQMTRHVVQAIRGLRPRLVTRPGSAGFITASSRRFMPLPPAPVPPQRRGGASATASGGSDAIGPGVTAPPMRPSSRRRLPRPLRRRGRCRPGAAACCDWQQSLTAAATVQEPCPNRTRVEARAGPAAARGLRRARRGPLSGSGRSSSRSAT